MKKQIPTCSIFVTTGSTRKIFHPGEVDRPPSVAGASVVIGAVVNFRSEKGLDLLIDAYARIRARHQGTKLVLVGFGPIFDHLRHKCNLSGLPAIAFLRPAAPMWPTGCAPSISLCCLRSESFSNALLEAMASGCCVVGSRVGGTPNSSTTGKTACLFESGDLDG